MADGLFCSVGMPGFEPGAPCPPDKQVYMLISSLYHALSAVIVGY